MPRLAGTEEWNEGLLRGKARYYLDTIKTVGEVAREFWPHERAQDPRRVDEIRFREEVTDVRLEQFTEAMALLLVSDRTDEAMSFFADLGWVLNGFPTSDGPKTFGRVSVNIRQFVGLSLFAALAKDGGMLLGETGLEYRTSRGSLTLSRDRQNGSEFLAVLPTLFFVALATRVERVDLYILSKLISDLLGQYGALGLFERPEAKLLGIYSTLFEGNSSEPRIAFIFGQLDGFMALRELERRYTSRIREMRSDRYHWVRMNAPGDLVDWVLLIAQVAMLRDNGLPFLPENFPASPETHFCWDLARALA